jgi:hypothetical protein
MNESFVFMQRSREGLCDLAIDADGDVQSLEMLIASQCIHAFNYDLCRWGYVMKSSATVSRMLLDTTSCPEAGTVAGPSLSNPKGPFCHKCD